MAHSYSFQRFDAVTKFRRQLTPVFAAILCATPLAACTTPAWVSPVEVTRFTTDAPALLGSGTINIAPATSLTASLDAQGIEYGLYEAQLAQELAANGYSVVQGEAAQTAILNIEEAISQPQRRSPVSVGGGGSVGSYRSGVGLGVGIDLSSLGGAPAEEIAHQVSVTIRPSTGGDNVWEGRASFTATANSEFADPALAAERAIEALFTGFPGTSGETIIIE